MSDTKPQRHSLSKTPSWIMLGFVIGCIVTLTVKREVNSPTAPRNGHVSGPTIRPTPTPAPPPPPRHTTLAEMEAIFEKFQAGAFWSHDTTEVAFWDRETNQFSEYVEVLRNGDDLYYRTIPKLTRPYIDDGVAPDTLIRFTETETARAERRARLVIPR